MQNIVVEMQSPMRLVLREMQRVHSCKRIGALKLSKVVFSLPRAAPPPASARPNAEAAGGQCETTVPYAV
jgi:hypothetical protein